MHFRCTEDLTMYVPFAVRNSNGADQRTGQPQNTFLELIPISTTDSLSPTNSLSNRCQSQQPPLLAAPCARASG